MSKELLENASSESSNKILAPLGALALAVTVIAISLALAVNPVRELAPVSRGSFSNGVKVQNRETLSSLEYDAPAGRKILSNRGGDNLIVLGPEIKISLKADLLSSWTTRETKILKPNPAASLLQYFYKQTRTAHPWAAYDTRAAVASLAFNEQRMGEWIQAQAGLLNQEARDATLAIENGRATKFTPERNGYTLDHAQALFGLKKTLLSSVPEFALPLKISSPKARLADLNELGIQERIVRGQSDFTGSTISRIQNIKVGSSQFNGVIIKPGEEFSFNTGLGSITEAKGYLPELVIKREGVAKELGGGLCQVSSTMFRAAFFAGLPITQRRNHSYAVAYYTWIADDRPRRVGLDATIYPGAQDMKFINDTPGHVLVWTYMEGKRLYFDFYGTKDERRVAVDGPDEYDRQPSGAVKARVTRLVTKNGNTEEKIFSSTYVSPNLYPKLYELPKPAPAPEPQPITN